MFDAKISSHNKTAKNRIRRIWKKIVVVVVANKLCSFL